MTWVDGVLVTIVAATIALAAGRRLSGLLVGVGGVLAYRPLLLLAHASPWLGLVGALAVGLLLALVGRHLLPATRGSDRFTRLLGGLGGAVLGVAIVISLVTALPIQRNPVEPGLIYYPPRGLPAPLQRAVADSELVGWGRAVLLYPLLDAQGAVTPGQRASLAALHGWFVAGEPWRVGGARGGT